MTDEMIVELYWQRDERAIKETELAYGGYIRYVAYAILRDENDAEEITNDTYLKAWNSIPPPAPTAAQGIFRAHCPSAFPQSRRI